MQQQNKLSYFGKCNDILLNHDTQHDRTTDQPSTKGRVHPPSWHTCELANWTSGRLVNRTRGSQHTWPSLRGHAPRVRGTTTAIYESLDEKNVKLCFYIAQYPVHWTAQSSLHSDLFIPAPTRLPWEAFLATQQLRAKTNHSIISTTVYSYVVMYTAEWTGASWRERKCPNFETVGDSNLDSLDCESGILPLSYRPPHLIAWIVQRSVQSILTLMNPNSDATVLHTLQHG